MKSDNSPLCAKHQINYYTLNEASIALKTRRDIEQRLMIRYASFRSVSDDNWAWCWWNRIWYPLSTKTTISRDIILKERKTYNSIAEEQLLLCLCFPFDSRMFLWRNADFATCRAFHFYFIDISVKSHRKLSIVLPNSFQAAVIHIYRLIWLLKQSSSLRFGHGHFDFNFE